VIKELTAMDIPESDKVALLSAYMNPDSGVEIIPGDKISIISPGHYLVKRGDGRWQFQFKIVDGKRFYHGENSHVRDDGDIEWKFFDNGVFTKTQHFHSGNNSIYTSTYSPHGGIKDQTRDSFVGLPKGDRSNLKELSLEYFTKWLTKNIVIAMNHGRNSLDIPTYISYNYGNHLTWLENFAKCNNYKFFNCGSGYYKLSW
jgi:hypothetical protein